MPNKTTPITARLEQADLDYLSQLEFSDATTLSEKMRKVLARARRQQAASKDPAAALGLIEDLLVDSRLALDTRALAGQRNSMLSRQMLDWLPPVLAVLLAHDAVGDKRSEGLLMTLVGNMFEDWLVMALAPDSALSAGNGIDPQQQNRILSLAMRLAQTFETTEQEERI